MKIKLINFGLREEHFPLRAHDNDVGADVFAPAFASIDPGETLALPLKFGLEIPDGYAGFIFPRSGLSKNGIVCELPPIDPGYRGQIHAVITNMSKDIFDFDVGDRIGQLVILPCVIPTFVRVEDFELRGDKAFGSTGGVSSLKKGTR